MRSDSLAVVIPAYKSRFLAEALESLAAQTDTDFNVYVGDDCSPDDIYGIVGRFADRLNLAYTKFPSNIGSKNLVAQWNRCVDLAGDEKWLWLFSDDDVAESHCVEQFRATLAQTRQMFDVYRFNVVVIDQSSKTVSVAPIGPLEETSVELAYNLLRGGRGNSMPDHIFRRSRIAEAGGFVFTEFAQGADWATSILFSEKTGIRIVPGPTVHWRMSGINISSVASKRSDMLAGHLQFIRWVLNHFVDLPKRNRPISLDMIKEAALINLQIVTVHHYRGLTLRNGFMVYNFLRDDLGLSPARAATRLSVLAVKSSPIIRRFYRKIRPKKPDSLL